MKQERRRFVTALDYVSSPGMPQDPENRKRQGLSIPVDSIVITDMAVFRFSKASRRMYLWGYCPGITPDDIVKDVGFSIDTQKSQEIPSPSSEELRLVREKIDPLGLIIKRKPNT